MEVTTTVAKAAAPEYLTSDGAAAMAPETMRGSSNLTYNNKSVVMDQFLVEEFFDFSNEEDDDLVFSDNTNAIEFQSIKAESGSSVTLLVDTSCNASLGDFGNSNLTSELCVPYDDLAELEWVSAFAEESFTSEDMKKLQFISGMSARPDEAASTHCHRPDPKSTNYRPEILVPGKARSKRPRSAPANWTSRLLLVSTPESDDQKPMKKPKTTVKRSGTVHLAVDGRKCLHCQTDKTPQWRTGPVGPKTLCNACGVRYKSGRLMPEYRPASSPTFVRTKHSNSHQKVLELRRQGDDYGDP